ncbi:MAG: bifunctional demethylmenaquinone methyltransferase/2-methoxy-6-polyprenyl-1,4-benzoquinol methylase UbiE [Ignavibacteriaceae bacterium]|nr:bifunctional demethylmenaquinone methyltransferase/2-methoxy-6-polyprenyl-1,4-benzoquinol methylase UbiE [Ignavibacteriaceae bacterium]
MMKQSRYTFSENEKKHEVRKMFDSIARSYDFLNHLLSFGIDYYWRKKAIKLTGLNSNTVLLDVACGTGDFAIEAKKHGVKKIYGADFSFNMLSIFDKKAEWIRGKEFQTAAEHMPVKPASVTNITVAFGVRNFYDIPLAFREFSRVLTPGGKATILEFRMPTNPLIKLVYRFYFKVILPLVGKIFSGHSSAYNYLPDSVEEFDRNVDLKKIFLESGFSKVDVHSLTFGTVQVVIARV